MRKLFATTLLLSVLAWSAGAFAMPVSFEVAGLGDSSLRAAVTADYNASLGLASFTLRNTTTTQGTITGFAFNLPGNGAGVNTVLGMSSDLGWHQLNSFIYSPNTISATSLGRFDVGMGTGSNFNGGFPLAGLGLGESASFTLLLTGPGISGLTTGSILAALSQPGGGDMAQAFAVRFQNTTGGGSDVGTPTPVPAAVWLLGSGLLGVLGLKRSRMTA